MRPWDFSRFAISTGLVTALQSVRVAGDHRFWRSTGSC